MKYEGQMRFIIQKIREVNSMRKNNKLPRNNPLNIKIDDPTLARLQGMVGYKKHASMTDAVHEIINGIPDTIQDKIEKLHLENNAIRQEVRELSLLLRDFIPQLITRGEVIRENEALGKIMEITIEYVRNIATRKELLGETELLSNNVKKIGEVIVLIHNQIKKIGER